MTSNHYDTIIIGAGRGERGLKPPGFDVRREVEGVGLSWLVVDDVGFGVRIGHGSVLLCVYFIPD